MKINKTEIEGVLVLEPEVYGDQRGYFMESYRENILPGVHFIQDNESSSRYGVVRGLHYQKGAASQAKLVRVVSGKVLDVAVDLRKDSPSFGKHVAVELSGENHRQLFIPRGFAHGFSVLSESVVFQYKCDNYYAPEAECGVAWDDPDLGIDWKVPADKVILSAKDSCRQRLCETKELF